MIRTIAMAAVLGLLGACATTAQQSNDEQQKMVERQIQEHRAKVVQYLQSKQPDQAIADLQALAKLTPQDVEVRSNLGVLLFFKNDCQGAIPELRQAIGLREGLWRQELLLGLCEARTGEAADARKDLEAAFPHLTDDKSVREAGFGLLDLYAQEDELQKAAGVIEVLRTRFPTDPGLQASAFHIYNDLASQAMLNLSLIDPESAQMHQIMGHEMLRYGDRANAIAQYKRAIEIDPKLPGVHYELAEALNQATETGKNLEAEKEFKLALEQDPNDVRSLCRLGEMAEEVGDLDEAAARYTRVTEVAPNAFCGMIGLAKVYANKEPAKAAALLEKAEALDPTNDIVHYRLNAVYRRLGRMDDAKREVLEYQKYKKLKDQMREIYKKLRMESPEIEEKEPVDKNQ